MRQNCQALACRTGVELSTPPSWKTRLPAIRKGGVMRVKILLQITDDDGTAAIAEEVAAFEKVTERPEDLGLSIAEGKALLAAVQQRTIDAQIVSWMELHRCCEACGQRRRVKGSPIRMLPF